MVYDITRSYLFFDLVYIRINAKSSLVKRYKCGLNHKPAFQSSKDIKGMQFIDYSHFDVTILLHSVDEENAHSWI